MKGLFRRRATIVPDTGAALGDSDRAVLDALRAEGADLAEPRHVLYFLYFGHLPAARAAAADARAAGWVASVQRRAGGRGEHRVRCERDIVADEPSVATWSAFFALLATQHGGVCDGWEAAV